MVRQELGHVKNHALDDEVAALFGPAQAVHRHGAQGTHTHARTHAHTHTHTQTHKHTHVTRRAPCAGMRRAVGTVGPPTVRPASRCRSPHSLRWGRGAVPNLCCAISGAVIVGEPFLLRCLAMDASTSAGRPAGEAMAAKHPPAPPAPRSSSQSRGCKVRGGSTGPFGVSHWCFL